MAFHNHLYLPVEALTNLVAACFEIGLAAFHKRSSQGFHRGVGVLEGLQIHSCRTLEHLEQRPVGLVFLTFGQVTQNRSFASVYRPLRSVRRHRVHRYSEVLGQDWQEVECYSLHTIVVG